MEPSDLLRTFVGVLDRLGIRYLVTGSMATITYGEPRFTNDVDVVVELTKDQLEAFCLAFPAPEFYCSRDAAAQAVQQRFQFNILHPKSGFKLDVIIPADDEFDRSRFNRRIRLPAGDNSDVWFASPEDVILKKMVYFKEGQSEKHIRDIIGVMKVRGEKLDRPYIERWAERLQVADIWRDILNRADKP